MERLSFRAVVHGRVQGVGFREFVRHNALALDVAGYARNLPGGRAVEVAATGTREALDMLLRRLHEGPAMARVSKVDVEWGAPVSAHASGFEIVY